MCNSLSLQQMNSERGREKHLDMWKKTFSSWHSERLTGLRPIVLWSSGRRGRAGRKGRPHGEPEDAPLLQTTVVVMQVAGVQALVPQLQVWDGQREVPQSERVLGHAHLLSKERSVVPPFSGGVQVHQALSLVGTHTRGLEVPVSHLLLVLQEALPPQGAPIHARQRDGAAEQNHKHGLLTIPVTSLLPDCKCEKASMSNLFQSSWKRCLDLPSLVTWAHFLCPISVLPDFPAVSERNYRLPHAKR